MANSPLFQPLHTEEFGSPYSFVERSNQSLLSCHLSFLAFCSGMIGLRPLQILKDNCTTAVLSPGPLFDTKHSKHIQLFLLVLSFQAFCHFGYFLDSILVPRIGCSIQKVVWMNGHKVEWWILLTSTLLLLRQFRTAFDIFWEVLGSIHFVGSDLGSSPPRHPDHFHNHCTISLVLLLPFGFY